MIKRLLVLALGILTTHIALAKDLPDFTGLVEKQGAAVVNVSTTQIVRAPQGFQGMPNLPENDPFYEFFKRFAPQMPREQESQSLGSAFYHQCRWIHPDQLRMWWIVQTRSRCAYLTRGSSRPR